MMGTMWSSLFVRFEGSIEWNYLGTIRWNHIHIWMKDVHRCHQNTQDHRIARSLWFFFFFLFFTGIFIHMDDFIPGFLAGRSTLYGIVWYDGMEDPYGKYFDFSCKYADQTVQREGNQLLNCCTIYMKARKWTVICIVLVPFNHLEFSMLMLH